MKSILIGSLHALCNSARRPLRLACGTALAIIGCVFVSLPHPVQAQSLPLLAGFEGIRTSANYPDSTVAAGPGSLVLMVNSQIAVYNKQGARLFLQDLGGSKGFWKAQGASGSVLQPWVIFDPNSGRFIASAADFGNAKGTLYLAVSKNAAPLASGDWHKYKIERTGAHQAPEFFGTPTYPDDAKAGVDGDAIYFAAAHFAKNQSITRWFSHMEIFAIAKAPLLSGGALTIVYDDPVILESFSSAFLPFDIQPAIVFEPSPAMFFVQSLTRFPDNKIVVHSLTDVLTANPIRSVAEVTVPAFDRPPDVPQFGSGNLLFNFDQRLMSAIVRHGSLWATHAIRDPAAADAESLVRWYEFDVSNFPAPVSLAQHGNVDPGPRVHAWYPSIGVDAEGNMGLGFSMGGPDIFAGIGYTGQLATDPYGSTFPVHVARYGEGAYSQYGWGTYSGLAIDPDGQRFWQFNQYAAAGNQWKTHVSAFTLAAPPAPANPLHCGDLDGRAAKTGKDWKATVMVTIHDGNDNAVPGATVWIQWSGGFSGTAGLTTDANGVCTFTTGTIKQQNANVALTINNVTHAALTYNGGANHDPETDSNGTSIVVNRP